MEVDEPQLLRLISRGWTISFRRTPGSAFWDVEYQRGDVRGLAQGTTLWAAVARACFGIEQLDRYPTEFVPLPAPPPFENALGGTEPLDAGEAAGKALTRRQRRAAGLDPDR